MKIKDICEGVKAGIVEIDDCGHYVHDPKEWIAEWYNDEVEGANGKSDGKWTLRNGKSMEQVNKEMRDHYTKILNQNVGENNTLHCFEHTYCFNCGVNYKYILRNNKLELRLHYDSNAIAKRPFLGSYQGDFVINENRCEFEHIKPYGGKINIESSLIFANFFKYPDGPEDKIYNEFSLNCHAGRVRISDYKIKNYNVAYGQLTNTSYGVYVHPTKNSIILSSAWIKDVRASNLTQEEFDALTENDWKGLAKIEEHECQGTVCCDVWRWEAGDKNKLGDNFNKDRDYVEVECEKGEWNFMHYYHCKNIESFAPYYDHEKKEPLIWARLWKE